jgi:hypothetical protein
VLLAPVPNPRAPSSAASRATALEDTVYARVADSPDVDRFGSQISVKTISTLRIGFQKIGGFSTKKNTLKDDVLLLKLFDFDIFGMAEMNIDWHLASGHEKLHFRTREWWESSHISYSYNCTDIPIKKHQHGGTALFSTNQSAH